MEGVEILSQTAIMDYKLATPVLITIFCAILIMIVCAFFEIVPELVGLFVFITSAIVLGVTSHFLSYPTDKYEYQVTISDEVTFNEFTANYEVIKQDGKIYTVKIKE